MNRIISLRSSSLAVGLLIGLAGWISMSQVSIPRGPNIEVIAHPRDMIQMREGAPFTVPAGKVLVLTAVGTNVGGGGLDTVEYLVDGNREGRTCAWRNSTVVALSMADLAAGSSIESGSIVTIHSTLPGNAGRLWGYLADPGTQSVGSTNTVRVPYRPHPRDFVKIEEGVDFTVPAGMLFVLTAFGGTNGGGSSTASDHALSVNGVVELTGLDSCSFLLPTLPSAPAGFTVAGGSMIAVVQIAGPVSPGRAWGYLVRL